MALILDTGALIAIERADRELGAMLQNARSRAVPVWTSAAVVAQVWRAGSRQVVLARTLAGVRVREMDEEQGRRIGVLLGQSGTADVVDAHVALLASPGDTLLTSDPDDLTHLTSCLGVTPRIVRV